MKANLTHPSTLLGICLIVASLILVFGLRWAMVSAAQTLNTGISHHADAIQAAGFNTGSPVAKSLDHLSETVQEHARLLRTPVLRIESPIDVRQPVTIQGPREDGALPIRGLIGN